MKNSRSLTRFKAFWLDPPRVDPGWGGAKLCHGGPLLQNTSSSDRKATTTNRMHSNDLEACGKKCCYFWFHSEVKFLTCFWRLFGLKLICIYLGEGRGSTNACICKGTYGQSILQNRLMDVYVTW